jgi:hypothetical protein
MLRVEPIQSTAQARNNLKHNTTDRFQNILESKLDIDHDQIYDKDTNEVVEDLDNLSTDTLKNLLREE